MAYSSTLAGPRELDIRERHEQLLLRDEPSGNWSQVQRDRADILDILAACRTALIVERVRVIALKKLLSESRGRQHA
jgi:hypothetical protein